MTDQDGAPQSSPVLPYFEHPPVIEVALAVEFWPAPGLGAANLVRLADTWSQQYPLLEEAPALPPSAAPGSAGSVAAMVVNVGAMPVRLLRIAEARDRMLQVQRDRLVLNWQRRDERYPHYQELRPAFLDAWRSLVVFVDEHRLGAVNPTSAEVTYVNRIGNSTYVADTVVGGIATLPSLGAPAVARFNYVWQRRTSGHDASVLAALDSAAPAGPVLSVTYREALPSPATGDTVAEALDRGHVDAVTAFTEITSDQAHNRWGRTQ